MDAVTLHERLVARFGERVASVEPEAKDPWIVIDPMAIRDICQHLHDDPELRFDALSNQSGVDYKDQGYIEVVYHPYSYHHRHYAVLKVRAPRDNPVVPVGGIGLEGGELARARDLRSARRDILRALGSTPLAYAGRLGRTSVAQRFRRTRGVSRYQHATGELAPVTGATVSMRKRRSFA